MSVNKEIVNSIRNYFLAIDEENSGLFHSADVDRVQSQDWWIERFFLVTKSEETALKALIKAMQWRKTFGVNDFTDEYFPEEVYKTGLFTTLIKDKEGRPLMWGQIKCYHKATDFDQILKKFYVYQCEKLDRQTSHEGWAVVNDMSGTSLFNYSLDFNNFTVDVLQSYYPKGPKYIMIIDLPWILNMTSKLVIAFMNEELKSRVKFVKKDGLVNYIAPDYIPVHLNGNYEKNSIVVPKGVKPLEQLSHTKFTSDQIKKIYSIFSEELKVE